MMKAAPPEPICLRGAALFGLRYGQRCSVLDCIWAISIDKPNNPVMTSVVYFTALARVAAEKPVRTEPDVSRPVWRALLARAAVELLELLHVG